ncbi:MAG TPA: SIS domain-containing protein [Ktedonobacteraceae bacterium]|jgi:D-sedoheptulose 7-phosphate isomerase
MNTAESAYDRLFSLRPEAGAPVCRAEILAQVRYSTIEKCRETIALRQQTYVRAGKHIVAAACAAAQAFAQGATLLAFGNGGSATDAQDLVGELIHPPLAGARPLPALALTNDSAVITAVANDVGCDNIFVRQIIALGQPGDIAVGISTSGNSPNMLRACEQAHTQGLLTIGLAGYDGGQMARSPALDFCLVVPGDHIPRIQEAQATVYHALLELIFALLRGQER